MDLGNTMNDLLKRISQSLAYYFTHRCLYYPVPEKSISLQDKWKFPPENVPSASEGNVSDQMLMQEWAPDHGKAVRQWRV